MSQTLPLQYALLRGMQSCSLFNDTNIVLGRDYIARKIEMSKCWMTASPSGKFGIGQIIQVPETQFPKPNSLQRERLFGIGIYENPVDNWRAGVGTFKGADDWADDVVDFLWNWRLWRSSGLTLENKVTVPDDRFEKSHGVIGMIVLCTLRQERKQTARPTEIAYAVDGARNVTLTSNDGSDIYYTTDGITYPSPKTDGTLSGEQAAVKYVAPFQVAANTTVMAAAFAAGKLPSQTATFIVQ